MACVDYDTFKWSLKRFKGKNILLHDVSIDNITNLPIFTSSFSISYFLILLCSFFDACIPSLSLSLICLSVQFIVFLVYSQFYNHHQYLLLTFSSPPKETLYPLAIIPYPSPFPLSSTCQPIIYFLSLDFPILDFPINVII